MGDSLQNYRMTIGLFSNPAQKRNLTLKTKTIIASRKMRINSLLFLALTLLQAILVVFGLNMFLSSLAVYSNFSGVFSPDNPSRQLREVDYNFLARYAFGNKSKTGLRLAHINLGGGFLINKVSEIERIVSDQNPHVLGLSETRFEKSQDVNQLAVDKYQIYFADTLLCPEKECSRLAVLVHEDVVVKVRHDLMNTAFSSIWLEIGFRNQRKILLSNA